MWEIVLATHNEGKLKEFKDLLGSSQWKILSLKDFPELFVPEETGTTFQENARIKATAVASATGIVTIGDDSGLEVDYLGGLPGVYSARFAGEDADDMKNNEKLLLLLNGVQEKFRKARFCCTIAIATPSGKTLFCEGFCEGIIITEPVGTFGFGYDPLFWLPQFEKTMAQLTMKEKNQVSHRGKAFREAVVILEKLFGTEV